MRRTIGAKTPEMGEERSAFEPLEWTDEKVAKLWHFYNEYRPDSYFTAMFGHRLLKVTSPYVERAAVVADYGCGNGHLLKNLIAHHRVIGIDTNVDSLDRVRTTVGDHPNLLGLTTPIEAGHFAGRCDVVFFVETVEHLLEHWIEPTFKSLRTLLKPGGRLICTTPNDENLAEATVVCPETGRYFHRFQHVRSFTPIELSEFLSSWGFAAERVFTTNLGMYRWHHLVRMQIRRWRGRKQPHLIYVGRMDALPAERPIARSEVGQ